MLTIGCHRCLPASDFLTIALLVALEGLLSADNAMVLAVLVLGLPKQSSARRFDTASSARSRSARCDAAGRRISSARLGETGRGRLPDYLAYQPLLSRRGVPRTPPRAKPWLGLSAFWATVVKVELTDIVFAIDSILVAVAMSPKIG